MGPLKNIMLLRKDFVLGYVAYNVKKKLHTVFENRHSFSTFSVGGLLHCLVCYVTDTTTWMSYVPILFSSLGMDVICSYSYLSFLLFFDASDC